MHFLYGHIGWQHNSVTAPDGVAQMMTSLASYAWQDGGLCALSVQDGSVALGIQQAGEAGRAASHPLGLDGLTIAADVRLDNRAELLADLRIAPAQGNTLSDTELLLHAYRRWGEECPAHLLGDFFLQPKAWIADKVQKKFRSGWLYVHALLHGVLALLLVWDISFWWAALIISITHLLIDGLKMIFQNDRNERFLFFIDQLLHLTVIGVLWYVWSDNPMLPDTIFTAQNCLNLAALLVVTLPSSVFIKIMISHWMPFKGEQDTNSLESAGKYIGMLERIFVLVFILTGHWEGIGFLIAAKSIFRFGDIKESTGLKLTEYFMIGTLLSFGMAIFTGLATLKLIELVNEGY